MTQTFEITDAKNFSKEEAQRKVNEHYHDRLTYKGQEFFDTIYVNRIIPAADDVLEVGRNGQECYLGYVADLDQFISGWDVSYLEDEDEDEDDCPRSESTDPQGNWVLVAVLPVGLTTHEIGGCGLFYSSAIISDYDKLHRNFPSLIDIRLD